MHAASGKMSAQSQSGPTRISADKLLNVSSVEAGVNVAARQHLMLTAQGAYIRLEGGNIEVHGPGQMDFKATMKELTGPVAVPNLHIANKIHELEISRDLQIEYVDADGNSPIGELIKLNFQSGDVKSVTSDTEGKALLKNVPLGPFRAEQTKRR